jgi:SAM-dependent methyltransferase
MSRPASCLVCGGAHFTRLHRSTYRGTPAEAHRYFLAAREAGAHGEISRCDACGFVFTSDQFEPAEYDRIYARVASPAPGSPAGPGAAATRKRFERLQRLVALHVDAASPFLDFGCGDGGFLAVASNSAATGFETGAPGRRRLESCGSILTGAWPDVAGSADVPAGSQAFVTAFDVFEHLANLSRDVELIRDVLQSGGHLFITIPDIGSVAARVTGARWNMLLLEHLWYFDGRTLERFLRRHGFERIEHRSVPYDASIAHVAKRIGESMSIRVPEPPQWLSSVTLPAPAGVLFGAYRRR